MLKRLTSLVIPETQTTIISTRKQDSFFVDAESVDDCFVSGEIEDKGSFGTFPFLDAVKRSSFLVSYALYS